MYESGLRGESVEKKVEMSLILSVISYQIPPLLLLWIIALYSKRAKYQKILEITIWLAGD